MKPEDIPLRDLHLPDPVGWWPPAPGWWLLVALLLAGALWYAWQVLARWRQSAPRRRALAELQRLSREYVHDGDVPRLAIRLSGLLRRSMLAYAPRAEVAGLTGTAWLQWLDRGLSQPVFADGPGRQLESLPYRRVDADADDVRALLAAVQDRLRTPLPGERS